MKSKFLKLRSKHPQEEQGGQLMWKIKLLDFTEQFKHPGWGVFHSQRVYDVSLQIVEDQTLAIDKDALFAAAYLHDVGAFDPYKQEGVEHSLRSTQVAAELLVEMGFPIDKVPLVQDIIHGHMFYSEPSSQVEAIILHDADILDFMGAVGITRLLSMVQIDNWTPDISSAISLIERFSKELPQRLHTLKAQMMAKDRQAEMDTFLQTLSGETNGLQSL